MLRQAVQEIDRAVPVAVATALEPGSSCHTFVPGQSGKQLEQQEQKRDQEQRLQEEKGRQRDEARVAAAQVVEADAERRLRQVAVSYLLLELHGGKLRESCTLLDC